MFEWQTGQKEGWDEPVVRQTAVTYPFNWRRWLWPALGLFVLALLVLIAIRRRLDSYTVLAERDILAAHNLVQKAVQQQDASLLQLVLSDQNEAWSESQLALVHSGAAYAYLQTMMPLHDVHDSLSDVSIRFAPDMQTAYLSYERHFWREGDTAPLGLRYTAVFHPDKNGWRYASPDPAYWGDWRVETATRVKLTYPRRDEPIVAELLPALDAAVVQLCSGLNELRCPEDWRLALRLETDPASIAALSDLSIFLSQLGQYELPTPTLVGTPTNAEGTDFLTELYRQQVLYASLVELTGYDCCRTGMFFHALADLLLAEEGLTPSPLNSDSFWTLLRTDATVAQSNRTWAHSIRSSDGLDETRALVAFLKQHYNISPLEMIDALAAQRSFDIWLASLITLPEAELERAWDRFILDHTAVSPQPITIEHALVLTCRTVSDGSGRYSYDFATGSWTLLPLVDAPEPVADKAAVPLVSPDGAFAVWTSENAAVVSDFAFHTWRQTVWLRDNSSQELHTIGEGGMPLWLDSHTLGVVGVVRNEQKARRELAFLAQKIGSETWVQHFNVSQLLDVIPEARRPNQLTIQRVLQHPKDGDVLFVQTSSSFAYAAPQFIFRVKLAPNGLGSTAFLFRFEQESELSYSPDLRWLQIDEALTHGLTLYNLESGAHTLLGANVLESFYPIWTPNNDSVLQFRHNNMLLYNPRTRAYRAIPHRFTSCTHPAWLSP